MQRITGSVLTLGLVLAFVACEDPSHPGSESEQGSAGPSLASAADSYYYDGIFGKTAPEPAISTSAMDAPASLELAALSQPVVTELATIDRAGFTGVSNCIPFGSNTFAGFSGFIYRDIPAFNLQVGDKIAFDLGALNAVDTRRNIYLAQANKNPPQAQFTSSSSISLVSQDIRSTGWTLVVNDAQVPENPRGNTVVGDFELVYTAVAPFTFAGGGLLIGFGGSPPGSYADGGCDQVLVTTDARQSPAHFYARFYSQSDQTPGTLDGVASDGVQLGGVHIYRIVTNTAPTAAAGGPYSGVEGAVVALAGATASDPDDDPLTIGWSVLSQAADPGAACSFSDPAALQPTVTCTDDGTYTLRLTVSDGQDPAVTSDAVLTLTNASPSSGPLALPVTPLPVGSNVSLTASFEDPGSNDTHTATVEWGDLSSTSAAVSESNGAGGISASHTYTSPGVYTVRLLLPDDDGVVDIEQFQFVVIYDPNGGFVTGGGWITSPPGAYPAEPGLSGKANLGFVSKYQKGSTAPSGHTEFQFHAAGFEFESASYEWLVIAGARAQYKGLGRVNGTGDYGFLLTATDGQVSGGGGQDRFRLKVWDRGTGMVVYDSQLGDAEDAEPVTTLGGGSIVVHKK